MRSGKAPKSAEDSREAGLIIEAINRCSWSRATNQKVVSAKRLLWDSLRHATYEYRGGCRDRCSDSNFYQTRSSTQDDAIERLDSVLTIPKDIILLRRFNPRMCCRP